MATGASTCDLAILLIDARKGVLDLLDAARQLRDWDVPYRLLVSGIGPSFDETAAGIRDMGLADRVEMTGYVGYDEGGVLTEAVRRRPYQVVLFDEVEKAHPDVFNVLLQVLDDGRLTDGQGRTVDFRNVILILTSNLGAQALSALPEGADSSQARTQVMDAVRAHFRPEFLNRLDEIIIFHRLTRENMDGIVKIQLMGLESRLAQRKIHLDLDEDALKWLADEGYDPVFGARPLKRVIQRSLQNPLAGMLLDGSIKDGDTVHVSADRDGLVINGQLAEAA